MKISTPGPGVRGQAIPPQRARHSQGKARPDRRCTGMHRVATLRGGRRRLPCDCRASFAVSHGQHVWGRREAWSYDMNIGKYAAVAPWIAAVAASLTLAEPASATVHYLTYTGVVTSALDSTGEFGAGASLIGMPFTANVVYDDAKLGATSTGGAYYD